MTTMDREAVRAGLRACVERSGLTQSGLARAIGTSASRFSTYVSGGSVPGADLYLRAGRIASGLRVAAERGWMSAPATAQVIAARLAHGDRDWALRMVVQGRDHLRAVLVERSASTGEGSPAHQAVAAWEARPGPTGDPGWDRLLAALVAREFEGFGSVPPEWTHVQHDDDPWLFANRFFTDDEVRQQTPAWLAEHNLFIAERDLTTA